MTTSSVRSNLVNFIFDDKHIKIGSGSSSLSQRSALEDEKWEWNGIHSFSHLKVESGMKNIG